MHIFQIIRAVKRDSDCNKALNRFLLQIMATILFFESYKNLKLLAKEELEEEGFHILLCESVDDVLDMMRMRAPDVLVTQYMKPQTRPNGPQIGLEVVAGRL